jgi:hypothetical protein
LSSAKPESCRLYTYTYVHLRHHTISMLVTHTRTSICSVEKFIYLMDSTKFHIDLSFRPVALDYLELFLFYLQLNSNALVHLLHSVI